MPNVNFYLKSENPTTGKCLIYLKFKYQAQVLVYSFGQTILKDNWDEGKQRVKNKKETTQDKKYLLNDLLDNLQKTCERAYNTEIKNGVPVPETLRKYLVDFMNQKEEKKDVPTLHKLIERFISGEIKYKLRTKAYNTLKTYTTVYGHIKSYEREQRKQLTFEDINLDFYYKYVAFLQRKELAQNTIAKHIQVIKVFMNEAVDLNYTSNLQFKNRKFIVQWVESDAVYLTDKELRKLYNYDFSKNKKLEQVRDLFVFGCYVGLRFSDYSDIKPENIVLLDNEFFLKIITKKNSQLVYIPCSPVVLELFQKYRDNPNKLPKTISNQKLNDYIKDACKEAKLTEKGRLITEPAKELWECISSHTARRSFATNLYLESFPPIEIMKITGHKTESSFLKYIRVSKLDTAKRLNTHMKKMWSQKLLNVA